MRTTALIALLGALALPSIGHAQGRTDYLNFEAPPVRPLAVVEFGSDGFLMVANPPAGRLEIYELNTFSFVTSVPTGLEPVSVAVKPTPLADGTRLVYTANWLGDSITLVEVTPSAGSVTAKVRGTVRVGDEPMHIAFMPVLDPSVDQFGLTQPGGLLHEHVIALLGASGAMAWLNPDSLLPLDPALALLELLSPDTSRAIQAGRTIAVSPPTATAPNLPNAIHALNLRGGVTPPTGPNAPLSLDPNSYDFDVWTTSDPFASFLAGGTASGPIVGGLGSTNFNMAVAANGDLFVVGQVARNLEINHGALGEAEALCRVAGGPGCSAQSAPATGFTTSMLWRVRGAGTANPVIDGLDLNFDGQTNQPVAFGDAVTQPTDVAIYYGQPGPTGAPGGTRIVVTGFASDSLAIVDVASGPMSGWNVTRIDMAPTTFGSTSNPFDLAMSIRGPRALAIREFGQPAAVIDFAFVFNWHENSFSVVVINAPFPQNAVLTTVPLQFDPRPSYVREGRRFLYSSKLSASNTVSCASCHIDGHTDQLAWNLSDGIPQPIPSFVPPPTGGNPPITTFAGIKGPMVTQSFRGLVNFEVEDPAQQDRFFSNRPYHWRGDRDTFLDFNTAFINLMGIPNPSNPTLDEGIPSGFMFEFNRFINSIHYPPNAEQPISRVYSGEFFSVDPSQLTRAQQIAEANDEALGSQALRGLKLFHEKSYFKPQIPVATCASCHNLPEGSDNLLTDLNVGFLQSFLQPGETVPDQQIETAALRGMVEKEKRLLRRDPATGDLDTSGPITGISGFVHTGATAGGGSGSESLALFNEIFSVNNTSTSFSTGTQDADVLTITKLIREFDSGVAPSIGLAVSINSFLFSTFGTFFTDVVATLESFADSADSGLVVHAFFQGEWHGFFYEPALGLPIANGSFYREVPNPGVALIGTGLLPRSSLLGLLNGADPDALLVLQNVPLGDERRIAYLGNFFVPTQPMVTPIVLALEPMSPNSSNQWVSLMDQNWQAVVLASPNPANPNVATGLFQRALELDAACAIVPAFGLDRPRHEAPRRFRVFARDALHGARLELIFANSADLGSIPAVGACSSPCPPAGSPLCLPPTTTPSALGHPWTFELPIHPTRGTTASEAIWETAAELTPDLYTALMNGISTDGIVEAALNSPQVIRPNLPPTGNPFTDYPAGTGSSSE